MACTHPHVKKVFTKLSDGAAVKRFGCWKLKKVYIKKIINRAAPISCIEAKVCGVSKRDLYPPLQLCTFGHTNCGFPHPPPPPPPKSLQKSGKVTFYTPKHRFWPPKPRKWPQKVGFLTSKPGKRLQNLKKSPNDGLDPPKPVIFMKKVGVYLNNIFLAV